MSLELSNGSKVAVIGGGPAGSFFSYFLIELAQRVDLKLHVDIYEPRDFLTPGPKGCNMCAGIISETLIQVLAAEGINLPAVVVQRSIDSYVLHTTVGKTSITTSVDEKRIATVFRGAGPRDLTEIKWRSFDGYLLELAIGKGARWIKDKISGLTHNEGRIDLRTADGAGDVYDLVAVATGVNPGSGKMLESLGLGYRPPKTAKSHIREFRLGQDKVAEYLGDNVHIFLLDIPKLEYAAMIPKGDYATLCLIGEGIDGAMVEAFLSAPQVKECLPKDVDLGGSCRCSPYINIKAAVEPGADRIVFIGDSGASRLFKDGIGAAYRTAKAAATTAVFQGLSADDWRRHYFPTCGLIEADNRIGRIIFAVNDQIKKRRLALRGLLRMVNHEQQRPQSPQRMSGVLWDTFTGSAFYRDIFKRTLHPFFQSNYLFSLAGSLWPIKRGPDKERSAK